VSVIENGLFGTGWSCEKRKVTGPRGRRPCGRRDSDGLVDGIRIVWERRTYSNIFQQQFVNTAGGHGPSSPARGAGADCSAGDVPEGARDNCEPSGLTTKGAGRERKQSLSMGNFGGFEKTAALGAGGAPAASPPVSLQQGGAARQTRYSSVWAHWGAVMRILVRRSGSRWMTMEEATLKIASAGGRPPH